MTFVHSDLYLSTLVSRVAPAGYERVRRHQLQRPPPWVTFREQTQAILQFSRGPNRLNVVNNGHDLWLDRGKSWRRKVEEVLIEVLITMHLTLNIS
jgi:hypothetical protein